jgi:hypothetical protein
VNRRLAACLIACTAAVSMAAGHATLQSTSQDRPEQPPRLRTDVNLVLVDVHVSSGGRPVTDLTAADFSVRENGAVQQVATFGLRARVEPGHVDGRWQIANLRLAALSQGDYLVELSATSGGVTVQRFVPVRVGR